MSFPGMGSTLPRDDRWFHASFVALAALAASACEAPLRIEEPRVSAPVPRDHGVLCLDLGASRACWDGAARVLSERVLPEGAPRGGWRCFGQSADRFCELRTARSGLFACEGPRCVQTRTRAPDAAEWDCVDLQGVGVCHSELAAAGVDPGPLDAGYVCGARRGHAGERICVDLSPDVPDDRARWRCSTQRTIGRAERVCERAAAGVGCGVCPEAALCLDGVCVPPRPEPDCWLDADCAHDERCRWGTCAT